MPWVPGGITEYAGHVRTFSREMRLYILATLISFLSIGVFQVLFNLYLGGLGLREDYLGTYNAVTTICLAIAGLTIGPVVNRFGPRRVVLCGFCLFSIVTGTEAISTNAVMLLVLGGMQGVATAYFANPTNVLVLDYSTTRNRQHAISIVYSVQAISGTLGNLGGGLIPRLVAAVVPAFAAGSLISYRVTLLAGVGIAALALIPFARMRPVAGEQRTEIAGVVPPMNPESRKVGRETRRDFTVFILAGGLLAVASAAVIPFYNVYLTRLGANTQTVGYIYADAALFAAIIGLCGPVLASKFGALPASLVLRLLPAPFFAAMIFAPSLALAIPAHAMRTTSINASWPIDSTFIADLLPPRQRAYVFSIRSVVWNAVWAVTSILVGQLIRDTNSYRGPFLIYVVFVALNVIVFQVYYGRRIATRAKRREGPRLGKQPMATGKER